MDGVEANYSEDLDEDNSSNTNQRKWLSQRKDSTNTNTNKTPENGTAADPIQPTIAPIVDGDAAVVSASTTNSTASATPDTETEEIKEEEAEAEEPAASEDLSDAEPKDSPKANKISSDDEGEEDEPPPKKQKHISALPPSPAEGLGEELATPPPPSTKASKKSNGKKKKGKNNSVWTRPTSRKGKKRTKSTANSPAQTEDVVLITPLPRLPDKNDDAPDMKICLSKFYKAEKVELSTDRLTAGSCKGYRMVRATRGVTEGAWYFEIKVEKLGETGHTRLGWSTEKGDLQAPVGYDGNSYGYRDIDGSKIHKALREKYAEEGYVEGDVIGFYINLPEGNLYAPKPLNLVVYKGQRYAYVNDAKEDPPKVVPGSEISFFKNGIFQGIAFKDMYGGRYYPAASMYTLPNQQNCTVRFNFGPDFDAFPEDFGGRPVPKPMIEVPYHGVEGRIENGVSDEKKH